jgi:hypothetical protein
MEKLSGTENSSDPKSWMKESFKRKQLRSRVENLILDLPGRRVLVQFDDR